MAMKTVMRNMLGKWGILSIEMQKAVIEDEQEREIKDITDETIQFEDDSDIIDISDGFESNESKQDDSKDDFNQGSLL